MSRSGSTRPPSPGATPASAWIGAWATIEDLGSKNGTYVGEGAEPITGPTKLREGARFRLGRVLLVFRCLPDVASTKTEHSV